MTKSKQGQRHFGSAVINIVLVFIIVVAVNVIASKWFFRLDVTENSLYTLSEASRKVVGGINEPITLKYYFTRSAESLPLHYKIFGTKVEELLREYEAENEEMIALEIYDPKPDSDEEEWAKKYGLNNVGLNQGESLIIGLVGVREDREMNIPLLDARREQFLEYDITQLILGVSQKRDKTIGLMSSLPLMGSAPDQLQMMQGQRGAPKWIAIEELEKSYKVEQIETSSQEIEDHIDILVVVHPKNLTETTEYAIEQFALRGGRLVVMVDPNSQSDQTAAMAARMGRMETASSNLPKLFEHWGIEYDPSKVLGDLARATHVNAGETGIIPFALWHSLDARSFNREMIATKELEKMLMVEPGGFTLKEGGSLKLNSLIHSSTQSGLVEAFMMRFSDPLELNKAVKPTGSYHLAGILTGSLASAFDKRPDPPKKEESGNEQTEEEPQKSFKPHSNESKESVAILLIADTDFVADRYSVGRSSLFGPVPMNDNLNFFVNMIEFLDGAEELMQIRSRGRFSRPFTRFVELQQRAQAKYRQEEEKLSQQLEEVQEKLSQLNVQKGTNRIVLSKEQIEKIKQFREAEKENRSKLRKIRKLLRQDIEFEQTALTMLNLFVVPVLLAIFGIVLYFRRFQKARNP